jgi:hypothetical protein
VGTATLAFFRSLGGLIGVTGAGAILSLHLHTAMNAATFNADHLPPGASRWSEAHLVPIVDYRHAIAMVFITGACIVAVALVTIIFLPELPLRQTDDPVIAPSKVGIGSGVACHRVEIGLS